MDQKGNTVLVTGGASGIGLALAERFLKEGDQVIICGRREEKLQEAKQRFPALHTIVCDVSDAADRESLFKQVTAQFPDLNILVNNAGIQQRVNLLEANAGWDYYRQELAANVEGPFHLCLLFIPHLLKRENAAIINVSSGLAITPGAWVPIYSSTKAALHSFTLSLRLQLSETAIRVIEIFPPAVNTDLGGVGLHTFGAPLDDFANAVFQRYLEGALEIGYGGTEERMHATKDEIDQAMKQSWERVTGQTL